MLEQFYPDEYLDSTYEIDFEALKEQGYQGILFDIDNTLVEHGDDVDEHAIALVERLRRMGFAVCFLSNNAEPRVRSFCKPFDAAYIYKGGKPGTKGYEAVMKLIGTTKEQTVSVGDQIFTDVWGAKRTGIYTVLVKPIGKREEIQIVLKRYLEKIVLHFYKKKLKKRQQQ